MALAVRTLIRTTCTSHGHDNIFQDVHKHMNLSRVHIAVSAGVRLKNREYDNED